MSYELELRKKYADIKSRLYGRQISVVNEQAVKVAQKELWQAPLKTIEDLEPPMAVGGVVAPTGVVIASPNVKSGLTPLVDAKQSYINMLRWVANKHGIDPELIQGHLRCRKIVAARHELWWRIRTEYNYSYPRIAQFAERDHSSIVYAVATFAAKALDKGEGQVQSG